MTASISPRKRPRSFVLVHGAWHGGWCWRRVADRLRAAGHSVFTPTLTGLGERAHLMSREITLDTFTRDVVGVIEAEELSDIVLVGHSFAGSPISGAADVVPERIGQLVYLDAMIVAPGGTAFDTLSPDAVAARVAASQESSGSLSLPPPPAAAFGIRDAADAEWLQRRLTPQPLSTYTSPLNVDGPLGNGLPCLYVSCVDPVYAALDRSRNWARNAAGFDYRELGASHDAMVTAPEALASLLLELVSEDAR